MDRLNLAATLLAGVLLTPSTNAVAGNGTRANQSSMCLSAMNVEAACLKKARITSYPGGGNLVASGASGDTLIYDRCPPDSENVCPAGTYCCPPEESSGEYRCCK